jgi:integrase
MGRTSDNMTAAKAHRLKGAIQEGKMPLPQDKKRAAKKTRRKVGKAAPKTITEIWALYQKEKGNYGGLASDRTQYERRVKSTFGHLAPIDITPEIYIGFKEKLRKMRTVARGPEMMLAAAEKWGDEEKIAQAKKRIEKQSKPISKQLQIHALTFLRKLCFFAKKHLKEPMPDIEWNIPKSTKKPREKLTLEEIARLIDVCWQHGHPCAGKMILLALYTGARKTEILNLRWEGIDFENGEICLGVNQLTMTTKPGEGDDKVPMNSGARQVLESIPKHHKNPWVFPSPITGRPYVTIAAQLKKVVATAGLPENFRPMHGCRHIFGTISAGLGGALATKNLLRHKEIETSEIYIGLDNKHWGQISEQVLSVIHSKVGAPPDDGGDAKVINFRSN